MKPRRKQWGQYVFRMDLERLTNISRITNNTGEDRKEDQQKDEESDGKKLLQKPNKGKQTEAILVNGERRSKIKDILGQLPTSQMYGGGEFSVQVCSYLYLTY